MPYVDEARRPANGHDGPSHDGKHACAQGGEHVHGAIYVQGVMHGRDGDGPA